MNRRFWASLTVLTLSFAFVWSASDDATANAAKKDDKKEDAKDLFGLTKVVHLDLQVASKEWDSMQPSQGRGFPGGPGGFPGGPGGFPGGPGGFPGGPAVPEKAAEKTDVHKGSGFGMEFPWAHGELTAEGKTYKDIGIRFKGNASYMASSRGLKRNFKIDLDHYKTELRFHGLKSINLNAGAMDPSKAREALSFAVFRAAGVPAPRTAYAEVTLTVPGKHDKEYLGLYTFIEQVDRTFLKDRFKDGKGLLMKPEGVRGIEYLGNNWDAYKGRYRPKHDPSKKETQRLIDFAKLIHKANDEQFAKDIASYLDVDEFLRFLAANALLSNLDSFLTIGHNYYIYLNPETSKFVFIPWDMDLSMAGFPMMGGPDQQMDLNLNHPHAGENKLIDRLLAMKDVKAQYQKLLKELATTCFTKEKLLADIDAVEKATKEITEKEKKAAAARREGGGGFGFGPPGMFGQSTDLRTFVKKRSESIVAQLDGKSKGYTPTMGFGPGGPGGPKPIVGV
jgi:spore coat protein CotH